jgi:hypothetical protein
LLFGAKLPAIFNGKLLFSRNLSYILGPASTSSFLPFSG